MNRKYSIFLILYSSVSFSAPIPSIIQPILDRCCQLARAYNNERSKAIPVIAVAGCSAVGKTYFSRTLSKSLQERGLKVFILHQDDYLNLNRTFVGFKIHPHLDHTSLHFFLEQNSAGVKKIIKPCVVNKKNLKNKQIDLSQVDLILFEGIYALTGPETYNFVQYASLTIFLDSSTENMVKWHALRNQKRPFFQRFNSSDIKQHATCLLYEYTRFILPSKKNAQFVLYKDTLNSYRLVFNSFQE